jgi:hypothetical protein
MTDNGNNANVDNTVLSAYLMGLTFAAVCASNLTQRGRELLSMGAYSQCSICATSLWISRISREDSPGTAASCWVRVQSSLPSSSTRVRLQSRLTKRMHKMAESKLEPTMHIKQSRTQTSISPSSKRDPTHHQTLACNPLFPPQF